MLKFDLFLFSSTTSSYIYSLSLHDALPICKMTPSERFAFVSGMREQAQKRFEAVGTAANELLGVLDDAQKAKARDRKSTRLNSSHGYISYAVFCLKKKIQQQLTILSKTDAM